MTRLARIRKLGIWALLLAGAIAPISCTHDLWRVGRRPSESEEEILREFARRDRPDSKRALVTLPGSASARDEALALSRWRPERRPKAAPSAGRTSPEAENPLNAYPIAKTALPSRTAAGVAESRPAGPEKGLSPIIARRVQEAPKSRNPFASDIDQQLARLRATTRTTTAPRQEPATTVARTTTPVRKQPVPEPGNPFDLPPAPPRVDAVPIVVSDARSDVRAAPRTENPQPENPWPANPFDMPPAEAARTAEAGVPRPVSQMLAGTPHPEMILDSDLVPPRLENGPRTEPFVVTWEHIPFRTETAKVDAPAGGEQIVRVSANQPVVLELEGPHQGASTFPDMVIDPQIPEAVPAFAEETASDFAAPPPPPAAPAELPAWTEFRTADAEKEWSGAKSIKDVQWGDEPERTQSRAGVTVRFWGIAMAGLGLLMAVLAWARRPRGAV